MKQKPKPHKLNLLYCCCGMHLRNYYISINFLDILFGFIMTIASLSSHVEDNWYSTFQILFAIVNIMVVLSSIVAFLLYISKNTYKTQYHRIYILLRKIFGPFLALLSIILIIVYISKAYTGEGYNFHDAIKFYLYWFFQSLFAIILIFTNVNDVELIKK